MLGSITEELSILVEALRNLEFSTKPTLHRVIPVYISLLDHLKLKSPYTYIKDLRKELRKQLKIRYWKYVTDLEVMATILCPVTKGAQNMHISKKRKQRVLKMMRKIMSEMSDEEEEEEKIEEPPEKRRKLNIFSKFLKVKSVNNKKDVLDTFLNQDLSLLGDLNQLLPQWLDNPMLYWSIHKHVFPKLYKLSKKILIIPASSAPSERVFSIGGFIMSGRRYRLDPDMLSILLSLHTWV